MSWYYNLGNEAPSFSFTRDNGTVENYGEGGSQRFETSSTCEMVRFIQSHVSNPRELERDFFENLEVASQTEGCPISFSSDDAIQPQPSPDNPPVEVPTPEGDTPQQQGAPEPISSGRIGSTPGSDTASREDRQIPPTEELTRPPTGNAHPTHGGDLPREQTSAGDPVDIFSGSFYLQEADLEIPNTVFPLAFVRFYKSGAASFGPFGWNWDHNFNLYLRELKTGDVAIWRNLHEEKFKFDGVNFEPQRGTFELLQKIIALTQVYEIKGEGGIVMRFERPAGWIDGERIPIIWIKDRHGNQLRFRYSAEDKLSEVRDDDDRFFKFDYDQCGLLTAVSDHTGRMFQYKHDEETMQLVWVKSPAISDHPDGITRIYHYEQPWALPELRHNIIRVEDARGNVYLENTYEQDPSSWSYARVTAQLYGGFLYQFQYTQLQYVPASPLYINIPALRVEVMNPDFGLETYTFNYRGDLLDRRYRLSKDKSNRVVVWQYEFDDQGNPSKTIRPDGSEEINIFDFGNPDARMRGMLLQKEITSASGFPSSSRIIWRGKYESQYQQLIEEKNEAGVTTIYKYDFNVTPAVLTNTGKLIEIIQPDATRPDGTLQTAKSVFEYNSKNQPTAIISPDGTRNELEYGTTGQGKSRLIKVIYDAGGIAVSEQIEYDSFGFCSKRTDRNGNTTEQLFNALGLPEKTVLPAVNGLVAAHIIHYDSDKKAIKSERPKGSFTDGVIAGNYIIDRFERDVLGFPVKWTLSANTAEQRVIKVNNNYKGFPEEIINPDGSISRKQYDERGLLLTENLIGTDGKKLTVKKAYDRIGKMIQETNEFELTVKFEYDGFSRLAKVILANGTEIRNTWLKNNLLESEEIIGDDGTGSVRQLGQKSYIYDEKGRRVTETIRSFTDDPAVFTDVITTYFYDKMNRIEKVVNNRNGISWKQYNTLGWMSMETDPMGNEEHYFHDNNGNLLKTESHHVEPDGTTSVLIKQYEYDARNRRIGSIEPDGAKIISEYDDRNLLVSLTDQQGIVRKMFYNSFNTKIREIEDYGGLNISKQWTSDNMSRITSFIDPMSEISNYRFDSVGRNISIQYPNGFLSNKIYNDKNQIVREQLGSGAEFVYTYDTSNRITKIANDIFPVPLLKVDTHEFTYDGMDRVLSAKASINEVNRKYDSRNRLVEEIDHGGVISCIYNDATGEVNKTWPDGRTERLTHDLNGVLIKIEEIVTGALGSGKAILALFKPSGRNLFGKSIYANQITIVNSYDERKRLTKISATSPVGLNESVYYYYNSANLKQVEAIYGNNPKLSFFEFDTKHRLVNASDGFASPVSIATTQADHNAVINNIKTASVAASHQEKFLYNAADSRTEYLETGVAGKDYTYLPGHRIQSDGINIYTHFSDGTLSSDTILNYEADALGRITKIKSGGELVTEIIYDAFGRPSIIKESGNPDKFFHYFGGFVEQESEVGGAFRQTTLHPVTGIPIAYHSATGTQFTIFDSRFNLIALLDDEGNLVESYRYKSFGQPQIFQSTGLSVANSEFGVTPIFGGQRYMSVSGLYLSKRRLMNPMNGAFLSADPKGYSDSSSLYVYVCQNPVDLIDPEGEIAFLGILAVMAIGAVVAGGLNAARQGIAIAEGSQNRWDWGQFGLSIGIGAVAAPLLVIAPELAVPFTTWGIAAGIGQIGEGHYATGFFDIAASLAPFGFKGARNATFGQGTRFGQMRGLGESSSWSTRTERFSNVDTALPNYADQFYNRSFYRGTTYYEALEAEQSVLNLENVFNRQRNANAPPRLGIGLYFTEAIDPPAQGTASYWADTHGGNGRGGGPAVLRASIPRYRWWWLRNQPGVESSIPQPDFPILPSTLESYIPENGGLASYFNRNATWRIVPDALPENNFNGLWPLLSIYTDRRKNEISKK